MNIYTLRHCTGLGRTTALALLAASSVLVAALPASAAPLFYKGTQQIGSVLATYSITTDGSIGDLTSANITAFDVTLSDSLTTLEFGNTATLGNGIASGKLIASATALSMYASNSALVLGTNAKGPSGNSLGQLSFYGSVSYAVFGDAAHNGFSFQQASVSNTTAFANVAAAPVAGPTAAVPEPAAWTMMIVGIGAIGFAMRRQKVATRVFFAA